MKGSPDLFFISALDWGQAWVHVEQDLSLKMVSSPSNIPNQKGQKVKVQFTGPNALKVDLDLEVGDVCPPSQPCDTTNLSGTLSAARGAQKAVTRVTGGCGC